MRTQKLVTMCSVDSESETSSNLSHGLIQAFNVESRIVSSFNVDIIQAIFDMTNVVRFVRYTVQISTHKGHIVKVMHKLSCPRLFLIQQRFVLLGFDEVTFNYTSTRRI